ncbi:hypothetical protein KCU65_g317, partial [Aureobasidium melanogenum]
MQLLPLLISFPFLSELLLFSSFFLCSCLFFFWASKALLATRSSIAFCFDSATCSALALRCSSLALRVSAIASAADFAASIHLFPFLLFELHLDLCALLLTLLLFLFLLFLFFLLLDQELSILSDSHSDGSSEQNVQGGSFIVAVLFPLEIFLDGSAESGHEGLGWEIIFRSIKVSGKSERRVETGCCGGVPFDVRRVQVSARRRSVDESHRAFEVPGWDAMIAANILKRWCRLIWSLSTPTPTLKFCSCNVCTMLLSPCKETSISPYHSKGVIRPYSESKSVACKSQIAVGRCGIDEDMCCHKIGFLVSGFQLLDQGHDILQITRLDENEENLVAGTDHTAVCHHAKKEVYQAEIGMGLGLRLNKLKNATDLRNLAMFNEVLQCLDRSVHGSPADRLRDLLQFGDVSSKPLEGPGIWFANGGEVLCDRMWHTPDRTRHDLVLDNRCDSHRFQAGMKFAMLMVIASRDLDMAASMQIDIQEEIREISKIEAAHALRHFQSSQLFDMMLFSCREGLFTQLFAFRLFQLSDLDFSHKRLRNAPSVDVSILRCSFCSAVSRPSGVDKSSGVLGLAASAAAISIEYHRDTAIAACRSFAGRVP